MEEEERQGSRSSQDKDTLEDKDKDKDKDMDKDKEDKDALEVEVVEEKEGKQTRPEDLKLNQVNPGPGNPMLDSKEPPKEFEEGFKEISKGKKFLCLRPNTTIKLSKED